jgi:hypothetical protein|tara:strand:+ start:6066 stop:6245 length:180 start_codon:yes stop_codon:yes gene_type:complete
MNSDLATKIADRFSIEDIADATGITTNMFIQAFADEIMDNLSALSEIDQAFDTQGEEDC